MQWRRVGPWWREDGGMNCHPPGAKRSEDLLSRVNYRKRKVDPLLAALARMTLVRQPSGPAILSRLEQKQQRQRRHQYDAAEDVDPREREHARLRLDLFVEQH